MQRDLMKPPHWRSSALTLPRALECRDRRKKIMRNDYGNVLSFLLMMKVVLTFVS
jgi:hypothetical protein